MVEPPMQNKPEVLDLTGGDAPEEPNKKKRGAVPHAEEPPNVTPMFEKSMAPMVVAIPLPPHCLRPTCRI